MSLTTEQLQPIKLLAFDYDGVFTNGQIIITSDGHMLRSANARDGFAVQWACKQGIPVALISGGKEESVGMRMRYLGVQEVHMGSHNKSEVLSDICSRLKIELHEVLYMGDDLPDLAVIRRVGLGITPANGSTTNASQALWQTAKSGGHGAVREVAETILEAQGKLQPILASYQ